MLETSKKAQMDILLAKEERAACQSKLLSRYPRCLISFVMNLPGAEKNSAVIRRSFDEGVRQIERLLGWEHITILEKQGYCRATGPEELWAVDAELLDVKRSMVVLEESHELGRLFDIDVLSYSAGTGETLSRTRLGLPPRSCLLCSCAAHECSRQRKHSYEELTAKAKGVMERFFLEKRADEVATMACRSMLYEVSVSPKPGLVDRFDPGAHKDMDFYTFLDSSSVLTPWFRKFFLRGTDYASRTPQELFTVLRGVGILAERDMLDSTHCNTHKGLIFTMGILCGVLGWLYGNQKKMTADELLAFSAEMVRPALTREINRLKAETPRTAGEKLLHTSGRGGIRSEALQGYPTVRQYGLPTLKKFLAQGCSVNDAGVYTLLSIMAHADDSNVYARSNAETQERVRRQMLELTAREAPPDMKEIQEINREFIERNISPGGCADLLAITYFLYFYETTKQ